MLIFLNYFIFGQLWKIYFSFVHKDLAASALSKITLLSPKHNYSTYVKKQPKFAVPISFAINLFSFWFTREV